MYTVDCCSHKAAAVAMNLVYTLLASLETKATTKAKEVLMISFSRRSEQQVALLVLTNCAEGDALQFTFFLRVRKRS
jgi:mitochondrial fission protein ELM1